MIGWAGVRPAPRARATSAPLSAAWGSSLNHGELDNLASRNLRRVVVVSCLFFSLPARVLKCSSLAGHSSACDRLTDFSLLINGNWDGLFQSLLFNGLPFGIYAVVHVTQLLSLHLVSLWSNAEASPLPPTTKPFLQILHSLAYGIIPTWPT